jgi:signal peptide peptidase SppA
MQSEKLDSVVRALSPRIFSEGGANFELIIAAESSHRAEGDYTVADGVAIIPVVGSLVHRGDNMGYSGTTAYHAIDRRITLAIQDVNVKSILLDIDSPGGEVSGCFDLADRIYALRSQKKIVAMINDLGASGAYAIASQCSEIAVTQAGSAGSIGVRLVHVEYSKALNEAGIKYTIIDAGANKSDGNPYEPLPDAVRERLKSQVDQIYTLFTESVARGRDIKIKDVIATEAQVFMGVEAVNMGLADRVSTLEAEFDQLRTVSSLSRFSDRNNVTSHTGRMGLSRFNHRIK